MAVVFLIGGTGNQLFSYAASEVDDPVSTLLLRKDVRQILGWTQHEQVLQFAHPALLEHFCALTVLCLDLILAKFFRLTLFTELDTQRLKISPRLKTLARLGYFQIAPERRSLSPLARQIAPVTEPGLIALHIRGGDLLELERAGKNVYGLLDSTYFNASIHVACVSMAREGRTPTRLLVLTDDPKFAASMDFSAYGVPKAEIQHAPLSETLARAVGAEWYISSNSTLSYWIVRLRDGQRSIAPQPFQKRYDYDLPIATQRLAVTYN